MRGMARACLAAAVVLLFAAIGFAQTTPDCMVSRCEYLPLLQKSEPSATSTTTLVPTDTLGPPTPTVTPTRDPEQCAAEYPTVCIPPPPPDLDCPDIPYTNFTVLPPDRHHFDGNNNGIGCEA